VKYGIKIILVLLLIAVTFQVTGCTSLFGPSDEEVIKAINDSGILKDGGFTVAAPIVVLEKGKQGKDGSWPVKIKLTLTLTMDTGQTSTRVTTPLFRIHKSKDSAGKTVWTAIVGP
jgi:hypothetical protein